MYTKGNILEMNLKVNLRSVDPKQIETRRVGNSNWFRFCLELDSIPDTSWIHRFNQHWLASFPTLIFDSIKQDIPYDTVVIKTIHPERKEEIILFVRDVIKKTNADKHFT